MRCLRIFVLSCLMGTGASVALRAQSSAGPPASGAGTIGALDLAGSAAQNPLFGAVPESRTASGVLHLSLADAVARGLKYNLGILLEEQSLRSAQGARLRILSELLPNVRAIISDTGQQINLAAFGFTNFPGINPIVGPFNVFDARLAVTQTLLDFRAWNRSKAEVENTRAEQHTLKDTRDLVVLVCGSVYLQVVAGKSRIDTARAQLETAQALYDLATDRRKVGLAAGIDVLRAQVQLQAQQQRLIVAENDFAKQKLILARATGLPPAQEFDLTDAVPYAQFPAPALDDALETAYRNRGDYQAAIERVRAAELQKRAATGRGLPSLGLDAAYAATGQRVSQNHGTFAVTATMKIPIFEGRRVRAEVLEADATLRKRQAEAEELRARIHFEIQTSSLDLKSAEERVKVARGAQELAEEQVRQTKDRFAAGVTSTIEVVQSQEALATASENYISSLFAFNLAKATLARAMGYGESDFQRILRGR